MQTWAEVEARTGWLIWLPFAFQAARAAVPLLVAGIPRDHPRRDLLIGLCVVLGFTTDLLDGHLARFLRMTGLFELELGDRIGDFTFWIGAFVLVAWRLSLARDLGPERLAALRAPPARRRQQALEVAEIVLGVVMFLELQALIVQRTLR